MLLRSKENLRRETVDKYENMNLRLHAGEKKGNDHDRHRGTCNSIRNSVVYSAKRNMMPLYQKLPNSF